MFLVELQAYSLLPDWEMSPLGGIFRDFTWILGAFFLFFQKSCWVATTIAFVVVVAVVSFCLFCFVAFFLFFWFFLPICFSRYSVVVLKIIKVYIVLLCLLMKKKKTLNYKKKLEKDLIRIRYIDKKWFSPNLFSNLSINKTKKWTVTPNFWNCDGFY